MKNGNAAGYLYDFYRKQRRGLVQATLGTERRSLNRFLSGRTGSNRFLSA